MKERAGKEKRKIKEKGIVRAELKLIEKQIVVKHEQNATVPGNLN